ncbi:MAG: hypothetical protein QHI38_12210 [Armatimonadota bacterium]|nr:hypothetical protein [Armatimonadota bacterium]
MCGNKNDCKRLGNKVVDPKQCTPEQIRECHGETVEHPCVQGEQQCEAKERQ